jgi:hypothetical protein
VHTYLGQCSQAYSMTSEFMLACVSCLPLTCTGFSVNIGLQYTLTPFMSPFLISHLPFYHRTLGNGYTQWKIIPILSLLPLFISKN